MKNKQVQKFKIALKRKERRYFSEAARKAIIQEIEEEGLSKLEASRKYEVSPTAIYKWIRKYSKTYSPRLNKVVEHQSDSSKNKILEAELKATYELLGQVQAKNMLLEKIIELANESYQTDIKKTFASKPSATARSAMKKAK